ncbi:CocE/NonD family hydrolase [Marinimicrobium alkaliphilum]|uniref:CocE/NonD family hydrolase n=1 Tax=Marinimicrobium alkaliphilum TaxID=2202654 RepID=UPI000DB9EB57|nr:CocE/NonD family hydrolase [Marinimicrobium alkaliphilum]
MRTVAACPYKVRIIENTFIRMDDGTLLAARIWLPEGADSVPVPAIMEYIPYRKRDITRARDAENFNYLAGHGYACVRIDMRGSGDSEGLLLDEYTQIEQLDAVKAIAWIAEQAWCDGKVGMMGISWGGFNSLQVAARGPPALTAIISACASDDLYDNNMHYMGGCLLGDNLSEATVMFGFNSLPPDPAVVGDKWRAMWLERLQENDPWIMKWLAHQHRNAYWSTASVCENFSAIQCPVYAIGGWADGFTNAVFRLLEHLEAPCKGLIGPWGHLYPHKGIPGPAIGFLQEALRWWDYWLKGIETGIMDEPALRAWSQDSVPPYFAYEERPGRWISEPGWPSSNITDKRCPLTRGHIRLPSDGEAPERERRGFDEQVVQSPLGVGLSAGKWCSYAAAPDLPGDQREDDGGSMVFSSDPLEQVVEIAGRPVLELELSVDKPQAMVAVRLSDVRPSGKSTRITYGLLNLTHRDGSADPQPLEPHRRYRVEIPLNGIAQRLPVGNVIRVSVSTSYWPVAWTPPAPVRLTVYPAQSTLVLPLREPRPEDDALRPFDEPVIGQPLEIISTAPGEHNWVVHKDMARNTSTLIVTNNQGSRLIPETDTELSRYTREWYSFREDDFTSVRGETHTQWALKRAQEWNVEVETRTILTCTETEFHVHARLDAYEGDHRIFSKNWEQTLPRDNL